MKTVLKLLAFLVVLVLAALAFIYSGIYDVAASTPDSGPVEWVLRTTQHRSVHRAVEAFEKSTPAPALDGEDRVRRGLVHYHEMCATCHGAPGVKISEIGQGLNPYPPELVQESAEEEPAELFWIVKHGIKMTGMPAFGATHSDEEIWDIVAFMKRMSKLSPQEYQALVQEAGLGKAGGHEHEHGAEETGKPGHTHAPGTPPHQD